MRYKKGDTVKVKNKKFFEVLLYEKHYAHNPDNDESEIFVGEMLQYCGEKLTVVEVFSDSYRLKKSDGDNAVTWHFADWMLEDVK